MKIRILLFCGIILALCLWLLSHQATERSKSNFREVQTASTNQQLTNQSLQPEAQQNPSIQKSSPVSTTEMARPTPEVSNALQQQIMAEWQAPIEFYGKAVDENTNPVEGASVQFQWDESPTGRVARTFATKSDSEGLFSLQEEHGRSLEVSVSKEGYYSSRRDKTGYMYALTSEKFSPSVLNPVVFHLQKKEKGGPLIHVGGIGLHTMRDYLLAADGKPTDVSLLDGRLMPAEQGDLQVEFKAGPPLDNFPSRITWSCSVTVPGGGLIQTDEEFPFLAPENGYQVSDEWSVVATNWTQTINKQYYVKLRDGNFGRVMLRVIGVPGRAYFRMESFLNPSSSPNLEPNN